MSRRRFDQKGPTQSRKKPNRWSLNKSAIALKYPTSLPYNLGRGQIETYMSFIRLAEISELLRSENAIAAAHINDQRVNEQAFREALRAEKEALMEAIVKSHPNLKQGNANNTNNGLGGDASLGGLKKTLGNKCLDKIYIPQRDYPEINFIGQLIGPRGSTLKEMEAETGAKISIRGKGSHKDGKARTDYEDEDEELHAHITADTEDKVAAAVRVVNKIIEAAATSGGENDLKKAQLKKLASINGTLRDEESVCINCGQPGHRRFECPEKGTNITNSIVCLICGGVGHVKSDCIHRNNPEYIQRNQKMDQEYLNFMAELGGSGTGTGAGVNVGGFSGLASSTIVQASELSSNQLSPTGGHYGPGVPVNGSNNATAPWAATLGMAPPPGFTANQASGGAAGQTYQQYLGQQNQHQH